MWLVLFILFIMAFAATWLFIQYKPAYAAPDALKAYNRSVFVISIFLCGAFTFKIHSMLGYAPPESPEAEWLVPIAAAGSIGIYACTLIVAWVVRNLVIFRQRSR